jgi:probable phosphoglycerate mutase
MTVFLLIRHADNDMLGSQVLAGRGPGVSLNENGRSQSHRLARRLAALPIEAIYSSPLERTRETAGPLAEKLGKPVQVMQEINEVDFGDWTGSSFAELSDNPRWKAFNTFRSSTRTPGGEMSIQVQQRMIGALEELCTRHPKAMVALFSHGDPIRTVIAHFLGIPLDFITRLRISPASVSVVDFTCRSARVLCVNYTAAADGEFAF